MPRTPSTGGWGTCVAARALVIIGFRRAFSDTPDAARADPGPAAPTASARANGAGEARARPGGRPFPPLPASVVNPLLPRAAVPMMEPWQEDRSEPGEWLGTRFVCRVSGAPADGVDGLRATRTLEQLDRLLDAEITARVAAAAREQRVQWRREPVQHLAAAGTEEMLRDRRASPLVQTALDVHRFLGIESRAEATGSTDSNVAVTRGIPAISVGRARGGDQHTLSEWADRDSALPATRMLLLLAVSLAGLR